MRWRGRRRSRNVEDRRGARRVAYPRGARVRSPRGGGPDGVRRAGAGTLVLIGVVVLALWAFAGIDPLRLATILAGDSGPAATRTAPAEPVPIDASDDRRAAFLSVVLAETEDIWGRIFRRNGGTYDPPRLVLYSDLTDTACGTGAAATGPFYCPADQTIYLDLTFFDALDTRFNAPGDFAQAYVLAHEVGHHVQHETGTLADYRRERRRLDPERAALLGVAIELQADCYAGVWAFYADEIGILEDGDIDEALRAAAAVGDDTLEKRRGGAVVADTFSHGTAAQRASWFRTGYETGEPGKCDPRAALL